MSFKNLMLLLIVSAALITGCGGGGGSSNPVGAAADPLTDYPTIAASYVALQGAVEDNAGDPTVRVDKFMEYVASDFTNIAGDANKFTELRTVTLSRLERYDFTSHTLTPVSHEKIDDNTVKIITNMLVNVVLKAGKIGNAPQNTPIALNAVALTWKKVGADWKIATGLPYTSTEYFGLAD